MEPRHGHRALDRIDRKALPADRRARSWLEPERTLLDLATPAVELARRAQSAVPAAGKGQPRVCARPVLQSAVDRSCDAARTESDRDRQEVRHCAAECAVARTDWRRADLSDEAGASLRCARERRHAAASPLPDCGD